MHDWFDSLVQNIADSLSHWTRGWRTAHQFGAFFLFGGVGGLLGLLLFGDRRTEPAIWWAILGIAVACLAAGMACFWFARENR